MPMESRIPPLRSNGALFLDIDGTLLEIAATPEAVHVPGGLRELLRDLAARQNGALALISGRPLPDIDRLFGTGLPLAAEHGAILRDAAGWVSVCVRRPPVLDAIAGRLREAIACQAGIFLEKKSFGIALHWRGAPGQAERLAALATDLAATHPDLIVQPAHQAIEIRAAGADKGRALKLLMRRPPFTGRLPMFVGDDVTDEAAIAEASRLGGVGLHVARDFGGSTAAVRAWLLEAVKGGHD